jgi:hypothetical protein
MRVGTGPLVAQSPLPLLTWLLNRHTYAFDASYQRDGQLSEGDVIEDLAV